MTLGVVDRALDCAFQRATNAFKHSVEGGELANWFVLNGDGHLSEHAEHGALTYRIGLTFKAIVQRNATDGRLEQRELIGHKRIAVGEVLQISEVLVMLAAIGELKQGLEVVELLVVNSFQQICTAIILGQQTLLDHLSHVSTGELETVSKASLDLGEVVTLLLAHVTEHGVHILLGGDYDPGPPLALSRQAFGDSLQVGHQLGIFGDVLAYLIDEEIQAEIGRLLV
ncbi:hypothetical protein FQZ97_961690 [compost metagenome]